MTTNSPAAPPPSPGLWRKFRGLLSRIGLGPSPKSENTDKADAEAKAKADAKKRELIRRIPLHEVLYEEYRILGPSKVGPKTVADEKALNDRREKLEEQRKKDKRAELRLEVERIEFELARVKFEKAQQALRETREKDEEDKDQ